MNAIEAGELLACIAAFDERFARWADDNERTAATLAWQRALDDVPFADAEQAVIGHYSDNPVKIMPAHVRSRVRAMRAERIDRHPVIIDGDIADNPAAYLAALRRRTSAAADRPAIGGGR